MKLLMVALMLVAAAPATKMPEPIAPLVTRSTRVVARVLRGPAALTTLNKDLAKDNAVYRLWLSPRQKELTPEERETLKQLIAGGGLSSKRRPPSKCAFNADLALDWFDEEAQSVYTVFCFTCGETDGDANIHTFDSRKLAAFAQSLFPDYLPYERAAAGKEPTYGPAWRDGGR
jgi:hypothetical protein